MLLKNLNKIFIEVKTDKPICKFKLINKNIDKRLLRMYNVYCKEVS